MNKKILFFTGEWCYPCKKLKELLDRHNIEYEVVDVDKQISLARKYEVNTLPTLILVDNDGIPLDEFLGYSEKVLEWYNENFG